jgi:hypothetical protein
LTNTEEQKIVDDIRINHLLLGQLFTDATFKQIAIQAFLKNDQGDDAPREFDGPHSFINGLKCRNDFSLRRGQLKGWPHVSGRGQRDMEEFTPARLLCGVPDHARIINADDSCCQVYPGSLRTWSGTDSRNIICFFEFALQPLR